MKSKLNNLPDEKWRDLRKVILFGYGKQGKKAFVTLKKDFEIVAIVDNDKNKVGQVEGINIIHSDEAKEILSDNKIIVTVQEHNYLSIRSQLENLGLHEYDDFVMYQQFVSEWYFKFKKKVYLLKTDIYVTAVCNLNCKNCLIFVPYWKKKQVFSLEQIMNDIDKYFQCVDYVVSMDIIGGEPFTYKHLDSLIKYIGEKYREKIGYLGIITNGSILPKDNTLLLIKKYNIGISISDYSKEVQYTDKVETLCNLLNEKKIKYFRNPEIEWFDFGFPNEKYNYQGDAARRHMECCNTVCHLVHDNKVYYCSPSWGGGKKWVGRRR